MKRSVAVALILAAVAASAYMYTGLRARSGVYLVVKGVQGPATAAIYVEAVAPEGPRPIMAGLYRLDGPTAIPLPTHLLRGLASRWASHRPGTTGYGLIVHMVVIGKSGKLTHILDSVTVPLKPLLDDKNLLLEATVAGNGTFQRVEARQPNPLELLSIHPAKNLGRVEAVDAHPRQPILPTSNEFTPPLNDNHEPIPRRVCVYKLGGAVPGAIPHLIILRVCWDPVVYITPLNISLIYPDPWFHVKFGSNLLLYVETPVAMLYNEYSYSGVISFAMFMDKSVKKYELYPAIIPDIGRVLDAIHKGSSSLVPGIEVWRGNGATWAAEGDEYSMSNMTSVNPEESRSLYIYSRPFAVVYKVTVTPLDIPFIHKTFYEAYTVISDIYVAKRMSYYGIPHSYSIIPLIDEPGLPPQAIMEALLHGSKMSYVRTLAPHEADPVNQLLGIPLYASCGGGFGFNIPVGAMAGALVCSALLEAPLGEVLVSTRCLPLMTLMGSFSVMFAAEPARLFTIGIIKNDGRYYGVGYNANEALYAAQSRYIYHVGGCTAPLPPGLYFVSK